MQAVGNNNGEPVPLEHEGGRYVLITLEDFAYCEGLEDQRLSPLAQQAETEDGETITLEELGLANE